MQDTVKIELTGGKTVLIGGGKTGGLAEVSVASKVQTLAADRFEAALGALGDLVAILQKQVGAMAARPSKVEMEFSASVTGKGDLWVMSGEGKGEFKVKLTWDGPKAT